MKNELLQQPELIPFTEFCRFQNAVHEILGAFPEGDAAGFIKPSSIAREANALLRVGKHVPVDVANQYYVDVPDPIDIAELSPDQFQQLFVVFGPDIMRAKLLSPTVLQELQNGKILPVGGACLIESWGEHLLRRADIVADSAFRAEIAETIIASGPTYTQITGTMLLGGDEHIGLMYREEFPWRERAKEYGVTHAQQKTQDAYDRIFAAVERRARLIDPAFYLIGIHFDDLQLEIGGQLRDRIMQSFSALPNRFKNLVPRTYRSDGYNLGWVRYTYSGPDILPIVKKLARQQGIDLDGFTLHTRTKQLDHFRAPTFLFDTELPVFRGIDQQYAVLAGLGLDYLQLQTHENGNGFVGFHDLTNGADIVHQTVKLDGDKRIPTNTHQEIEKILFSPVRLSASNLDQHIDYLKAIVFAHSLEGRQVFSAAKAEKSLTAQEIALQKKRETLLDYQQLIQLLSQFQVRRGEGAAFFLVQKEQADELIEKLESIVKEKAMQKFFKKFHIAESEQKRFLSGLLEVTERNGNMFIHIVHPDFFSGEDTALLMTTLSEVVSEKTTKISKEVTNLESILENRQRGFQNEFGGIDTEILRRVVEFIPASFPVGNNPLVAHAIQLSFDSDMRQFVMDAAALGKSNFSENEKMQRLYHAMVQIFPKIEAYLTFIMKGGEYPEVRFQKIYNSVV